MPTPRQVVYALLAGDPAVSGVVGGRIYHSTPPLDAARPLVLINTISSVPVRDLVGVAFRQTRVQVTVVSASLKEAETIALAARSRLEGFRGNVDGLEVLGIRVDNMFPLLQEDLDHTMYHLDVILTSEEVD